MELVAPALDEPDDADCRLLDGQLGDVDHGTAEAPMDRCRLGQLVVDLDEARVPLPVRLHQPRALAADVGEALGFDGQPDDLGGAEP